MWDIFSLRPQKKSELNILQLFYHQTCIMINAPKLIMFYFLSYFWEKKKQVNEVISVVSSGG